MCNEFFFSVTFIFQTFILVLKQYCASLWCITKGMSQSILNNVFQTFQQPVMKMKSDETFCCDVCVCVYVCVCVCVYITLENIIRQSGSAWQVVSIDFTEGFVIKPFRNVTTTTIGSLNDR